MLPMLLICGVGLGMMYFSNSDDSDHKLYIKCDGRHSKSYGVYAGRDLIEFQPKNVKCKLDIEVLDVTLDYIKFNSVDRKLITEKANGELETEAINTILVASDEEKIMFSVDNETKFSFMYK